MRHKKNLGNFSLSDSIEETTEANSFNSFSRLLPQSTKKGQTNPLKAFISTDIVDFEEVAQIFTPSLTSIPLDLPLNEAIDTFVAKHLSPSFATLDELLNASFQDTTYKPKTVKALSDVLDGLIEDL